MGSNRSKRRVSLFESATAVIGRLSPSNEAVKLPPVRMAAACFEAQSLQWLILDRHRQFLLDKNPFTIDAEI